MDAASALEKFELVPLAGGIHSLRSLANGQTFHPVVGPQKEAETVHVAGTRLVERANAFTHLQAGDEGFTIWDVGLGAAANALAAAAALAAGYRGAGTVSLLSFDHSFGAFDFALANRESLGYPTPYAAEMRQVRESGNAEFNLPLSRQGALLWRTILADFPARLADPAELSAPHAIFYDPYSPTVNPAMWTLETFAALYARTRADSPCLLTTYTRSTAVRVTLLLAGWFVGVGGATGEKDETTVAANVAGLLERPLPRTWLEKKVYASTNAAPLRSGTDPTRGPISQEDFEQLRGHPQFIVSVA